MVLHCGNAGSASVVLKDGMVVVYVMRFCGLSAVELCVAIFLASRRLAAGRARRHAAVARRGRAAGEVAGALGYVPLRYTVST